MMRDDFAERCRGRTDDAERERVPTSHGGLAIMGKSIFVGGRTVSLGAMAGKGGVAVIGPARSTRATSSGDKWTLRVSLGIRFAARDQVEIVEAWRPRY